MGTTTPLDAGRVRAPGRVRALVLALAGSFGAAAHADVWRFEPMVTVTNMLSSNPSFQPAGAAQADLVVNALPRVLVRGMGAGFKVEGTLGAEFMSFAGRTRADRVWPNATLNGNLKVVDRWLYLDGGLDATTTVANPLATLADSSTNRALYTRERISPYLEHEFASGAKVLARTDNTWVQARNNVAGGLADAYLQSNVLRYQTRPQPFGLRVDWVGSGAQYVNVANSRIQYDAARLNLLYAPTPEWTLGVIAGSDHGSYSATDIRQPLKGVNLRWTPSERTVLDARVEDRFFGRGWDVNFGHRSPFIAIVGESSRQATTYAAEIARLAAGADVAALLDASLQTRIPNPVDRAIAVQNLIAQRGLPASLANATILYSGLAVLQQRSSLSAAVLGGQHTVTFRVFGQTTRELLGPTDTAPVISGDAYQHGGSVSVTRRLNPEASITLLATRLYVDGLGVNAGRHTNSTGLRATLTQNVNPRTSVMGGLRVQQVRANSALVTSADEVAAFAGITHRF